MENIKIQFDKKEAKSIIIDPNKHQKVISITVRKTKKVERIKWNGLS